MVQTNTVTPPGGDAAVLRLKESNKGLALSVDGNGRYCYLDPFAGGMMVVAEACRNLACVGAEPIALTDCLNFGNPEKPEVYYQLEQCIRGIAEAARRFDAPVISGNVSLYNESRGTGIYPTPVVGALGLLQDISKRADIGFRDAGDVVVLIGRDSLDAGAEELAGSEYLEKFHGLVAGQPSIDLDLETAVQRACRRLIADGSLSSAHDCSDGGLLVTLAESCIAGNVGVVIDAAPPDRWDAALFGEGQSRIVVSLPARSLATLTEVCQVEGAPWVALGAVGGTTLRVGELAEVAIEGLRDAWSGGLERALGAGA
jgi:phosphoribosylformylglycinamidine synthase